MGYNHYRKKCDRKQCNTSCDYLLWVFYLLLLSDCDNDHKKKECYYENNYHSEKDHCCEKDYYREKDHYCPEYYKDYYEY